MATDDPPLCEGSVCERCGVGHLAVVVKSADNAYVICDQCHTVWAPRRPKSDHQGLSPSQNYQTAR